MSELTDAVDRYLDSLRQANASPHTLRNYSSDLSQFAEYFSPPGADPQAPSRIDSLQLREWLSSLYQRGLDPISIRRKLAAVRSLFKFLLREGNVATNAAKLVRTPCCTPAAAGSSVRLISIPSGSPWNPAGHT